MLIGAGADLNAQTDEGNTLMSLAVTSGELRRDGGKSALILRLVEAGADPEIPDGRAIENAFVNYQDPDVLATLAQLGFELDLRRVAGLGDIERMQGFFDARGGLVDGALHFDDRDLPDSLATEQYALDIALSFAASWNQVEAMRLLVDRGARINAQPPWFYWPGDPGSSALHRAANAGRLDAVVWLLEQGGRPHVAGTALGRSGGRLGALQGIHGGRGLVEGVGGQLVFTGRG